MQNTYKVNKEIFNKCLCSFMVQFLNTDKYNPAINGQIRQVTENMSPSMRTILKDTLINKISEVIRPTLRNKKQQER